MFAPQMMNAPNGGIPGPATLPPEPVPRIKPKHGYEWYQDTKIVKIRIPMKGITMKKIDIFVSDVVLKINITEKRWVRVIDLKHAVQFLSKETSVVYANEVLEIQLLKEDGSITWADLVEDEMDKEAIKERRAASFARKQQTELDHQKLRNDLKIQYDSHATKEMMRLEDQGRQQLEKVKTDEKNEALTNIFKNVDSSGKIQEDAVAPADNQHKGTVDVTAAKKKEFQPQIIWTHKYDDSDFYGDEQSMFDNRDLMAVEYSEKPKVRDQTKIDIGFTQRMYPGVAAREQHFKDAPMPKVKAAQDKAGDDLENKNPLWLKDRGDEFYKNQDFLSAIMAYNQAFKIDPTMIVCIANRCACNIQLFNYEETLIDANRVLQYIEELPKDDKDTPKNAALRVKTLLRKAIATSWKGEVQDSLAILSKCLDEDIFILKDCGVLAQFEDAKSRVTKRQESIIIKKQGDAYFKEGQYEEALSRYLKSMEMDGNETAMGNVSLTYLKMERNAECIDFCDQCIKKVQTFTRFSVMNPLSRQSAQDSNAFLIKLYLRKAKAQQNLNNLKDAFETVKQAIQINDKNSEAKEIYKSIEKSFLLEEIASLKAQAAGYVKENRITEALEVYNECLKKIDSSTDTIEFLAILLNRCACFLKTEQYEDIITTCLRGLKIIRSFKNRVISWTSQKLSKEDKEKLISFESRFLVRRANAYLKQNLVYNAKQDLDEALKLDPNNQQLQQDIMKIRSTIA